MAINQVGNITRNYSTAGVSSTTSSNRTTAISSNTSSTRTSSSTTGTTIKLSSATAKANSSTTMSYSGASSTAKVSSTTASTTGKVSSTTASTTGKVSSTTASTTGKVSSTTASTIVSRISISTTASNISSSTTVSSIPSSTPTIIEGDKYRGLTGSSLLFAVSMDYFGFSGVESSNLYELYEGIAENYGEDADYQFARVIASCTYGDQSIWRGAANLMGTDDVDGFMEENGLSNTEAASLKRALQNQALVVSHTKDSFIKNVLGEKNYEECDEEQKERVDYLYKQFEGHLDFTHMFATIACSLYEWKNSLVHKGALSLLTNDLTVEEAAGYGGDIFGVSFEEVGGPSLNNGDYMSDLDAVNICGRISDSTDIMTAILEYYSDLSNQNTNRAVEFVKNLGGYSGLNNLREKIIEYEEDNDADTAWDFFFSVKTNSEVLIDWNFGEQK